MGDDGDMNRHVHRTAANIRFTRLAVTCPQPVPHPYNARELADEVEKLVYRRYGLTVDVWVESDATS